MPRVGVAHINSSHKVPGAEQVLDVTYTAKLVGESGRGDAQFYRVAFCYT